MGAPRLVPIEHQMAYSLRQRSRQLRWAAIGLGLALVGFVWMAWLDLFTAVQVRSTRHAKEQLFGALTSVASVAGVACALLAVFLVPKRRGRVLFAIGWSVLASLGFLTTITLGRLGGLAFVQRPDVDPTNLIRIAGALLSAAAAIGWAIWPARPRWKVDAVRLGALLIALWAVMWLLFFSIAKYFHVLDSPQVLGMRILIGAGMGIFAVAFEPPELGSLGYRHPEP